MDWGIGMDRSTMIPGTIHIMLDIVSTYRGIERHSVISGFRYIRSITLYIYLLSLYIYIPFPRVLNATVLSTRRHSAHLLIVSVPRYKFCGHETHVHPLGIIVSFQ